MHGETYLPLTLLRWTICKCWDFAALCTKTSQCLVWKETATAVAIVRCTVFHEEVSATAYCLEKYRQNASLLYTSENCFGSKNPRFSVEVLPVISKSSSHSFILKVILQCQSSRLPLGVVKNWLSCHLNWTIWPEISYCVVFSYSKVGRISFLCSLLRIKGKITVKDTFFSVCVAAAVKSWPSEEFATTKKDPQVLSRVRNNQGSEYLRTKERTRARKLRCRRDPPWSNLWTSPSWNEWCWAPEAVAFIFTFCGTI